MLAAAAVLAILFHILVFPELVRRLGPLSCIRISTPMFPLIYPLMPFTSSFISPTGQMGVAIFIITAKRIGELVTYPCIITMLSGLAHRSDGRLHAFQISIGALANATGLLLAGLLTSGAQYINISALPWFVVAFVASFAMIPLMKLHNARSRGCDVLG